MTDNSNRISVNPSLIVSGLTLKLKA